MNRRVSARLVIRIGLGELQRLGFIVVTITVARNLDSGHGYDILQDMRGARVSILHVENIRDGLFSTAVERTCHNSD